jgi:iron complex transport system ATP-binding protein
MTELHAEELTAGYSHRPVVHNVSFRAVPGELVAIVGPNGAGKTTLLQLLSGQMRPTAGRVLWAGQNLAQLSPRDLARQLCYCGATGPAPRGVSVRESILLGRTPHRGWVRPFTADDHDYVQNVLEKLSLISLAERSVAQLSAGERQRVGIARAMVQEPKVLLIDEPTTHLDPQFQMTILRELRALAHSGLIVVVVLHDLNAASAWADRVVLFADGKTIQTGTPTEVFTSATLSAVYGHPMLVLPHPQQPTPIVLPALPTLIPG